MTDISREAVDRSASACGLAASVLEQENDMETFQRVLLSASTILLALRAEVDALEAKLAEAQAPDISALRNHGFAPGSYHCFCSECGKTHTADKRAWRCLECAEKHALAAALTPAEAAKVLDEWLHSDMPNVRQVVAFFKPLPKDKDIFEKVVAALRAIAQEGGE